MENKEKHRRRLLAQFGWNFMRKIERRSNIILFENEIGLAKKILFWSGTALKTFEYKYT